MLDRIAESLFWIGRYTERAENHARLLDVYYHLREDGDSGEEEVWRRMAEAIGNTAQYEEKFGTYREREVLYYLTIDPGQSNSLLSCIRQARDNLRTIRDQLPAELWGLLNGFYLWLKAVKPADFDEESPHRLFQKVKEGLAAFQGTARSIVLRDESWHMLEAGRLLERAENTVRLLLSVRRAIASRENAAFGFMMATLKSVGGAEAFRRQDVGDVTMEEVARFLILQEHFPRSVQFALTAFVRHLQVLCGSSIRSGSPFGRLIRTAEKICAELSYLEGGDIRDDSLDDLLHRLGRNIRLLEEAMTRTFFSPGREDSA